MFISRFYSHRCANDRTNESRISARGDSDEEEDDCSGKEGEERSDGVRSFFGEGRGVVVDREGSER